MRQTIHSKWHKIAALENVQVAIETNDAKLDANRVARSVNVDGIRVIFNHVNTLPKYVIYDDVVDMVFENNSPLQKSIRAMRKSGLAHLPFTELLVEFDHIKGISGDLLGGVHVDTDLKVREFVWLVEAREHKFFANHTNDPFIGVPFTLIEVPNNKKPLIILNANCLTGDFIEAPDRAVIGLSYRAFLTPFINEKAITVEEKNALLRAGQGNAMHTTATALSAVVALLRTKGVKLEHIEAPAKLNKSRVASGKAPISDHTVIRIGHLYDREGNQVKYAPTGRHMPVHWRAGHIRNQRFGPGLAKSYEVFIEPMLINYEEGTDVPAPVKEVTV